MNLTLLIKCKNKIIFSLNVLVIFFFFDFVYISVSCASKSYNRDNYKYRKRSSACSIYVSGKHFFFYTCNQMFMISYPNTFTC